MTQLSRFDTRSTSVLEIPTSESMVALLESWSNDSVPTGQIEVSAVPRLWEELQGLEREVHDIITNIAKNSKSLTLAPRWQSLVHRVQVLHEKHLEQLQPNDGALQLEAVALATRSLNRSMISFINTATSESSPIKDLVCPERSTLESKRAEIITTVSGILCFRKEYSKAGSATALPAEEYERMTADIVAAIKTVYDPEIPASIYDLGLIYRIDINDDYGVDVLMTLTAPGCPFAVEIPIWVEKAVRAVTGVGRVHVEVTFEPPWEMSRMSDEARLALNMF